MRDKEGERAHVRLLFDGNSEEGSWLAEIGGSGQTRSLTSSRQYSLILSYRYLCRSRERPEGVRGGGLSAEDGVHTPRSKTRCSSSAVAVFLRKTIPG